MSPEPDSPCAVCGQPRDEGRRMLVADGPPICDGCIRRYQAALAELLEEESRARSRNSELIAAEELALNLIDTLETSRAAQERDSWSAPKPKRGKLIELAHVRPEGMTPEDDGQPAPSLVLLAGAEDLSASELIALRTRFAQTGQLADITIACDSAALAAELREQMVPVDEVAESLDALARLERALGGAPGGPVIAIDARAAISSEALEVLVSLCVGPLEVAALVRPGAPEELSSPEVIKAFLDRDGRALWLSRTAATSGAEGEVRFVLAGAFALSRSILTELAASEPSPLERAEGIALLRVLEYGHHIQCAPVPETTP